MRDEDVHVAIVVDVADRHAHPVSMRAKMRGVGNVGELPRMRSVGIVHGIVAIQPSGARCGIGTGLFAEHERLALHDQQIHAAVVVVVEDRNTCADDFGIVKLAAHSVVVPKTYLHLFGDVGKQRDAHDLRFRRIGFLRAAAGQRRAEGGYEKTVG